MFRIAAVIGLSLVLSACAASGPAAPEPVAADAPAPPESPAPEEQDVGTVEAPGVPEAVVADAPRPGGGRICRMEKRTGTNRAVRVCRSVAEVQGEAIEAKKTFEALRRSQTQIPRQ